LTVTYTEPRASLPRLARSSLCVRKAPYSDPVTIGGERVDRPKSQGERVRKALGWALLGAVMYGATAAIALLGAIGRAVWLDAILGLVSIGGVAMVLVGLGLAAWHLIRG
jgi:hypothetical protein